MILRIGVEGYEYGEMFGSELTGANQGDGKGAGLVRETGGGGQGAVLVVTGRSNRTCVAVSSP